MRFKLATKSPSAVPFFILIFALSACGSGDSGSESASLHEITPEEMALEMGVPNEPGPRAVPERDFSRYPLVVDIFRRSTKRPVLGEFQTSTVDLITSPNEGTIDQRLELARSRFEQLNREFAVISLNGAPYKAQIISAGLEGYADGGYRTTPPGNYKLDIIRYTKRVPQSDGSSRSLEVDYPWIRSATFGNSIMYWGLWLFGGYFIHSTTHYGQLGMPASMGCIRQAYPDAMELFRLRQNHVGMIRVHAVGSEEARDRLREITSVDWVLPRLQNSLDQIQDYVAYAGRSEISVVGHAWVDRSTGKPGEIRWPNCGPVDCFTIWGRKAPN